VVQEFGHQEEKRRLVSSAPFLNWAGTKAEPPKFINGVRGERGEIQETGCLVRPREGRRYNRNCSGNMNGREKVKPPEEVIKGGSAGQEVIWDSGTSHGEFEKRVEMSRG